MSAIERSANRVWVALGGALFVALGLSCALIQPVQAMAVASAGMLGAYALVALCLRGTGTMRVLRSVCLSQWAAALAVVVVFVGFAGWYLSRYDFLPMWDFQTYWGKTRAFVTHLDADPLGTVAQAFASVNDEDYNDLQCWFMSLPVLVTPSWESFCLATAVFVHVPVALVLSAFCCAVAHRMAKARVAADSEGFVVCLVFFLACPTLLRPVLSGYMDELGMLLLAGVVAAVFDESLLDRVLGAALVGLLLTGSFLLRRWYAYAVVGLVVAAVLWWLTAVAVGRRVSSGVSPALLIRPFVLVALGAAFPLLVAYRPFVENVVSSNYAAAYAGWKGTTTIPYKMVQAMLAFGWAWIAAGAVGYAVVVLRWRHSVDARPNTPFGVASLFVPISLLVAATVSVLLFWRVQDLSSQHYYLFMPFVAMATASCMLACIRGWAARSWRLTAGVVVCALSAAGCAYGLSVWGSDKTGDAWVSPLGKVIMRPVVWTGVQEREELVAYLAERATSDVPVYFACSSMDLNASLVPTCALVAGTPEFLVASADVDSRDGFNPDFFDAQYVVCSNPVALHMDPAHQQVVVTLNDVVQDATSPVGCHFCEVASYDLGDKTALVYEKTSEFTPEDRAWLETRMDELLS